MRILLIDALNIIRRVYEATPDLENPEGQSQASANSIAAIRRLIRDVRPSHVLCAFEGWGITWRHRLHPPYKSKRKPTPERVKDLCILIQGELDTLGIPFSAQPGIEADDMIASIATALNCRDATTVIASSDHDFCQLLNQQVSIFHPTQGIYLDQDWATNKYQIAPQRLVELFALAGNSADSIPGVAGIGPKKAAALLANFDSLENLLDNTARVKGKIGESLRSQADMARLSRQLVSLKTDLKLGLNLQQMRIDNRLR